MKTIKTILILILSFVFAYCGTNTKDQAGPRTGVNALPYSSEAVFSVNAKNIIAAFPKIFNKNKNYIKQKKKILKKYGLDISKSSITGAILNTRTGKKTIPQLVLFINTSYKQKKLKTQIKKEAKKLGRKLKEEVISGYNVLSNILIKPKKLQNINFKLAFINDQTILITSAAIMKVVINLIKGKGKTVIDNPNIASSIKSLQRNNLFWTVTNVNQKINRRVEKISMNAMMKNFLKQHLPNIGNIYSSASQSKNQLNLSVNIKHSNSKAAKSLVKLLQGIHKLIPDPVLKRIKISQNGNNSNISFSLSKKEVLYIKKTILKK